MHANFIKDQTVFAFAKVCLSECSFSFHSSYCPNQLQDQFLLHVSK